MHRKWLLSLCMAWLMVLCACSYMPQRITTVSAAKVTKITLTDLDRALTIDLYREDGELAPYIDALKSVSVEYDGDCGGSDLHLYRVEIYIDEALDSDIYINSDQSFCRSGKKRLITAGEQFDYELFENLFELAAEENELEDGVWVPSEALAEEQYPLPASARTRWRTSTPAVRADEWNYFVATCDIASERCIVVVREAENGKEIVFGFAQNSVEGWSIEYVEGSYEGSGGRKLYFSLVKADGHNMLYCFDETEQRCFRVADEPCSNMIVAGDGGESVGWILREGELIPLSLKDTVFLSEQAVAAGDFDMAILAGSFFSGPGEGYDSKYSALSLTEEGDLRITVYQKDSRGENAAWSESTTYAIAAEAGENPGEDTSLTV